VTPREPRPQSDVATLIGTAVASVCSRHLHRGLAVASVAVGRQAISQPISGVYNVPITPDPSRRAASTNAKAPTTKVPSTAPALGGQEHAQAAWYRDWHRSTRTLLVNHRQEPWWAVLIIWLVLGAIARGVGFAANDGGIHTLWSVPLSMGALTGHTWYFWPSFNTWSTIVTCTVNGIGSVALTWSYQHPIESFRRRSRPRAERYSNLPNEYGIKRGPVSGASPIRPYQQIPGPSPTSTRDPKSTRRGSSTSPYSS
jgi:hypothetical protein